ncbi:hypothetical protein ANN_27371 [Periplaneta americana]|uniref:Uncharacterized protein n=1 Tax=Periplaneta americana TaxID=6978 RepID=A0ABQ8RY52_PERAM|nr:hypothetical protein ANN_27371 [Periplaneta americana]
MAGLCEGGNEPSGSLKAICNVMHVQSAVPQLEVQSVQVRSSGWPRSWPCATYPLTWIRSIEIRPYVAAVMRRSTIVHKPSGRDSNTNHLRGRLNSATAEDQVAMQVLA